MSTAIGNAKNHYAQAWHQNSLSNVVRYQPLQPEHVRAPYVKSFKNRKLISRFRCGCHGLHVDTGRLLPLAKQVPREQRHCVFCASGSAEDEHHFVFDCLAYSVIRNRFKNILWGPAPTLSSFSLYMIPKYHAAKQTKAKQPGTQPKWDDVLHPAQAPPHIDQLGVARLGKP